MTSQPLEISPRRRGYVTYDTADWLGGQPGYNHLFVQFENGTDEVDQSTGNRGRRSAGTHRPYGCAHQDQSDDQTPHGLNRPGDDGVVLAALGVLVMLLSGSLIFNTLSALLSQHRRQIGVMKWSAPAAGEYPSSYRADHSLWVDRTDHRCAAGYGGGLRWPVSPAA